MISSIWNSGIEHTLTMTSRLRRPLSFNSDSSSKDIVNSNETKMSPLFRAPPPDNSYEWTIRRTDVDTLYKIGTFNFVRAYSVKACEEVICLWNGLQVIPMIKQIWLKVFWRSLTYLCILVLVKSLLRLLLKEVAMHLYLWHYDTKDLKNTSLPPWLSFKQMFAKNPYFSIVILILQLILHIP